MYMTETFVPKSNSKNSLKSDTADLNIIDPLDGFDQSLPKRCLSNSFAFGGNNVVLALGRT